MFVPVIDVNKKPLMPTKPSRARKWIKSGKATPFWKRGVFCVRLNHEPSDRQLQPVAVGIDPGSKREGFTIKSKHHTYLNIQTHAIDWLSPDKHPITKKRMFKKALSPIEIRAEMRRTRRYRNTPHRKCRRNRLINSKRLPPSTKARWQWKLRICWWLNQMFPIEAFVVEDIKAQTKGKRRWDVMFSPLEVGKKWFYSELEKLAPVHLKQGWETKQMRDELGLKKGSRKLVAEFKSHCVDSWVLANWYTGGHQKPDNTNLMEIKPLRFHRRQLHRFEPAKNGIRRQYGSTLSLGLVRGSLVKHNRYGLTYVGGYLKDRICLHSIETGKRICQNAKTIDIEFLTYNTWRTAIHPRG
jgi:hypothetical protein